MIYGIHAIRMAGAEDFNAALNGTASYDTPELIEAAKLVQELAAKGGFGDSAMGTSEDDAVAAFKQGRAAMMFMGSWLNGDCEAEDAAVKGKINVIKTWLWAGYLKKMVKIQVLQRQMDKVFIVESELFCYGFQCTVCAVIFYITQYFRHIAAFIFVVFCFPGILVAPGELDKNQCHIAVYHIAAAECWVKIFAEYIFK